MHAGAVEHSDAFEMTAVCDIDPARRKQAEDRFHCPTYDDYREMLAKERLDLVCVITRSDQHCAMTRDCLAAGVSVLVTKPWAVNSSEAESMIAAADASGKMLLPWLPARWGGDLRRLRELVSEGVIGKPFLIRRTVTTFATRSDWQTERRFGGGYLLNWGPHIVDPPLLLADSPLKTVYAQMRQTINPGDVEDVFMAMMTLDDGAIVLAEFTISAEEMPDWIVQGDRGTITVKGRSFRIHASTLKSPDDPTKFASMKSKDGGITEETIAGDPYGGTHDIYSQIAAAVRGESAFPVTPEDALRLSRVLDAIRASSEENRVVSFTDTCKER